MVFLERTSSSPLLAKKELQKSALSAKGEKFTVIDQKREEKFTTFHQQRVYVHRYWPKKKSSALLAKEGKFRVIGQRRGKVSVILQRIKVTVIGQRKGKVSIIGQRGKVQRYWPTRRKSSPSLAEKEKRFTVIGQKEEKVHCY